MITTGTTDVIKLLFGMNVMAKVSSKDLSILINDLSQKMQTKWEPDVFFS